MNSKENMTLDYIREKIQNLETPIQIVNLDIVREKLETFSKVIDPSHTYYSIKANSSVKLLKFLRIKGLSFDASSKYEIETLLHIGVNVNRISFGNTIKKFKDVKWAYSKGVRVFTTDSLEDLKHIYKSGSEAEVTLRIVLDSYGDARWPLNKKFGASINDATAIFKYAQEKNIALKGLSFHVGSQQMDQTSWANALLSCDKYVQIAKLFSLEIVKVNLGGGFPANYIEEVGSLEHYLDTINTSVLSAYPQYEFYIEPGRGLVGDSGIIVSEVVLITTRNGVRWVYIDVGKYNGIISTIDERICYRIIDDCDGPKSEVVLAGPTCDSSDILYENNKVKLSDNLKVGDKVYILSTGAYTRDYSSINFNGLPPLSFRVVDLIK